MMVARGWGRRGWKLFNEYGVSVLQDEKFQPSAAQQCKRMYTTGHLAMVKIVHFLVLQFFYYN